MLGTNNEVVSYIDVFNISENQFEANYYTVDDQLCMETSMTNSVLRIENVYNISTELPNARTDGWFNNFAGCIQNFVNIVAVMMMPYML